MLDVTVIVCTSGERSSLASTLWSVLAVDPLPSRGLELLVVDNSKAETGFVEQVVERTSCGATIPIRYVREPRRGVGHARNAGIAAAHGEIVAFVDDDALVDPNWAWDLVRAYSETGAAAVGGKIDPLWAGERPRWLGNDLLGHFSLLDWGPRRRWCHYPHYPFGANMSFRRDVLHALGGFSSVLGVGGRDDYTMEDIELYRRLERAGLRILYAPDVRVRHQIPASRLSRTYVLRRAATNGRSTARMGDGETASGQSVGTLTKSALHALVRAGRHSVRALWFTLALRDREMLSEGRHVVWNLALMRESMAIALESRRHASSSRDVESGRVA